MKQLLQKAKMLPLIDWRRKLHQIPELGLELPETKLFVREVLSEIGYQPKEMIPSGLVALCQGEHPGACILLRADMDALPMKEESGLPFAATGELAHTCGHDMHTAMLLGAAALLWERRNELKGTIKLVFQPGEETMEGAYAMLQAGVLKNPNVEAAIAMHVAPDRPLGEINCSVGKKLASSDRFRLTVNGRGGHGASPELAIDPIFIAMKIYQGFLDIISKEIAATESVLLTVGSFHSGSSPNSIPEIAVLEGTFRTSSTELQTFLTTRLQDYAIKEANLMFAKADFTIVTTVPPLINDLLLTTKLAEYLKESGIKGLNRDSVFQTASEDFAWFSCTIPSTYMNIGTKALGEELHYGNHHPKVRFSEDILPLGSAVYAYCAMRWLEEQCI